MSELADNVFRANVGVVVVSTVGLVLALERIDIPGAWQLPQGGLDEGEEPIDAARRELQEETGIRPQHVALLSEHRDWLAYELPKNMRTKKHGRGQCQKWFIFRFGGEEEEIRLDAGEEQEFSQWKWMKMRELLENCPDFRKNIYASIHEEFSEFLVD